MSDLLSRSGWLRPVISSHCPSHDTNANPMKTLTGFLLASAVVLLTACSSSSSAAKPPKTGPKFSFVIGTDDSLKNASFTVDVLLVNASTRKAIESADLGDYFSVGSRTRESAKRVRSFRTGDHSPQSLSLEEHQRFPGYTHLAILADTPVEITDKTNDLRRLLIPLGRESWRNVKWPGKANEVTVTITSTGIRADPGWVE
jgi:hypothetical protein